MERKKKEEHLSVKKVKKKKKERENSFHMYSGKEGQSCCDTLTPPF